ncbi:MAG: hypothetical protein HND40_06635 [Ignavibacteriota bacterium]|jgi:hypothetical protein|nr:hypothetical protein [Ignavibacteriota bacterium]MBV6420923.1 hypothetical protein [Ignavibacteriaceae bacterium]MCO6446235.1 hypothetical protein [Ignavibacterium album]MDT3696773.1 hypothetical protein [Ignavibacterium sp.]MEB2297404.1 hypothetical protein [Ignavibacteria bacterium]
MKYLFALVFLLFISCSSSNEISWTEDNEYVIILLNEINLQVETYYAEITLESGRRIAIELGLPDEVRKFRIKNNFGNFNDIKLYTNLDLE